MNLVALIALLGWAPLAWLMFMIMPARRAVALTYVAGWLFLPMASFDIPNVHIYTKMSAVGIGALVGVVVFDMPRLMAVRPSLADLPMVLWCIIPALSSISVGEGLGVVTTVNQVIVWGVPYLIGRAYFSHLEGLKEWAVWLVIGGLAYVPLVLFEARMSPQLHNWIYGFHAHDFGQTKRAGGWRPTVFMQHGLAVGLFMSSVALVTFWLWWTGAVRTIAGIRTSWLVLVTLGTAVLCRSTGATLLLLLGVVALLATAKMRTSLVVLGMLLFPAAYIGARVVLHWNGEELIDLAGMISPDRAASLRTRLNSEAWIVQNAREHWWLGNASFIWSGTALGEGAGQVISDSLWILILGRNGALGLAALEASMLLPVWRFLRHWPGRTWSDAKVAGGAALAVVVMVFMCDTLLNAMLNPLFAIAMGGLMSATLVRTESVRRSPAIGAGRRMIPSTEPGTADGERGSRPA
jgi:hypothetical protein